MTRFYPIQYHTLLNRLTKRVSQRDNAKIVFMAAGNIDALNDAFQMIIYRFYILGYSVYTNVPFMKCSGVYQVTKASQLFINTKEMPSILNHKHSVLILRKHESDPGFAMNEERRNELYFNRVSRHFRFSIIMGYNSKKEMPQYVNHLADVLIEIEPTNNRYVVKWAILSQYEELDHRYILSPFYGPPVSTTSFYQQRVDFEFDFDARDLAVIFSRAKTLTEVQPLISDYFKKLKQSKDDEDVNNI